MFTSNILSVFNDLSLVRLFNSPPKLVLMVPSQQANNQDLADHDRSLVFCDRPATRPGVLVGELTSESNGLGGTFYVRDDKTFYIQLFSYDARATGVCVCVHGNN